MSKVFLLLAALIGLAACDVEPEGMRVLYFKGSDAEKMLNRAIDNDDPVGVSEAIEQGVDPDVKGLHGLTPLIYAVGTLKTKAAAELLRHNASTEIRDNQGNNAVTLAVEGYSKSPELLKMVLQAGGDPNTLFSDDDPVVDHFLLHLDFDGAEFLIDSGANIDVRSRTGRPLVMQTALGEDWDAVWFLLEKGAKFDYVNETFTWLEFFSNPHVRSPDSPLWPYKVKVWRFLKENGIVVPQSIEDLVDQDYWDYLEKEGRPKPDLEELGKI